MIYILTKEYLKVMVFFIIYQKNVDLSKAVKIWNLSQEATI